MEQGVLEQIGLTRSEINVYLALLELGSSSTGKIVDKSKATSSKIYEILGRLIQKGLVSFIIKSGVKYFEAAPPERIMDYMDEKEKLLSNQKKQLKDIIPELKLKQTLSKYKSEATIYKGMKGVETAFYSALQLMKRNDETLVIGAPSRTEIVNKFFVKFHKQRAKKGVKIRIIYNEKSRGELRTLPGNVPLSGVKFSPETTPASVNIYKNRVLIFPETEEHLLIAIDSKEVADSFRVQFEMWWNQDTTVVSGFKAFERIATNWVDDLSEGEEYYVLNATFGISRKDPAYEKFFERYHKHRIKNKVKVKLLFEQGTEETVKKFHKQYSTLSEVKFLPYKAKSPVATFISKDKILMIIQEKIPIVIKVENKNVASAYLSHFNSLWNQETRVVKGLDAIQNLFEEMLEAGSCDFIGARGYFIDHRPKYMDKWEKRAIKKGFTMRNIVDIGTKGHRITKFPFTQTKYTIPKEFSQLSVFWIYGDKVAISNWTEKEPIAVIIENKHLHDMYKQQFKLLWKRKIRA